MVGSDQWKAVQLCPGDGHADAQCRRDRADRGELEAIDALANLDEIYAFVREGVMTSFVYGFYGIRASPDLADSSTYAAWYTGPPLGLPNRDYYWTDDEKADPRGVPRHDRGAPRLWRLRRAIPRTRAERIYELEKRLAEPILRPEDFNDPGNIQPRPIADLIAANPDFDWPAFLEPRHPGGGDNRRHRAEVPERG